MKQIILGLLLCLSCQRMVAQAVCGTDEMRRRLVHVDPLLKVQIEQYNEMIREYSSSRPQSRMQDDVQKNYLIPVVVHVIDDNINPNVHLISESDITKAINNMNASYAGTGIEFKLAPYGANTTGIEYIKNVSNDPNYKNNGVNYLGTGGIKDEDLKNLSRWPADKYYNIWVVNKIDGENSANHEGTWTSGYGYPPGTSSTLDGTVILAESLNTTDMYHETGHYFGLEHPFYGCYLDPKDPLQITDCDETHCPPLNSPGDRISDTDPVRKSLTRRTGLNPCTSTPYNDNTECNIMGYTKCRDRFTQKQIEAMLANIEMPCGLRRGVAGLSVSVNCNINANKVREIGKAINKSDKQIRSVVSIDPNEKVGITTNTAANHVNGSNPFNYKIYFENKNTATAPAQEVVILDTLDKSKFDLSTFHLQDFGYGGSTRTYIPSSLTEYFFIDTLRRSGKPNLLVKTDAKLDTAKGILTWRFLSLDQQTNELVADPLDGFLPPNVTSPQGEGYVSYSVAPKISLLHGTTIQNKAAIYFDNNAPIVTNEFLNTVDKVKPVSRVFSLPVKTYDSRLVVKWSGMDADAGVRAYDIYYSVNDGPFQLWQHDISGDSSVFTGQYDSTYSFYSISKDYAGNVEDIKLIPEASTTVVRGILPLQLVGIEAKLVLNDGVITWKTLSESNSSHFELERSIDGVSFDNIVKIQAVGNSNSLLAYDYTDRNILALKKDKIYYRLKMVDKDGSFIYSNIRVIDIPTVQLLVNLAPNPFGNSLRVIIASPKQQICRIEISDPIGRRVLTDSKNINSGSNILQYYSAGWKPGIYIVKIIPATGVSKTFKILKK